MRTIFGKPWFLNLLLSAAIFALALLPRAYALDRFVTADEAKWVYRSAQFLAALLQGQPAGTSVNLTPAVTTTWLGSAGLWAFYQQQPDAPPLVDWLLAQPEFRTDLPLLVAARWPGVLLSALLVVLLFWQARALFNLRIALVGALFIALDPHTVALSRVLGHDIWAALFASVSLLALLLAARAPDRWWLWALSGAAAGLACLSKAPAFFLLPFAGLLGVVHIWRQRDRWRWWLARFALWGGAAYLAFVLVWPAAWVEPLGRPWAVVNNAFLSATDTEEAEAENYWRVPELGPWYYVVNGGFKLSPLVLGGVGLLLIFGAATLARRRDALVESPLFWLLAFALLFTAFMTLGGKRSSRYILPIFPALALVAAAGWDELFGWATAGFSAAAKKALSGAYLAGLTAAAAVVLLPSAPYYLTYYNPLFGGAAAAQRWVKIGWGEGLDQVGRFLQRELPGSRVGTAYASTVAPFFSGDIAGVTSDRLDYLVLYSKQVQSGEPSPAFIEYFEHSGPIFSVNLQGLHLADVYPGPALQPVVAGESAGPATPIAYRPLVAVGRIGEPLVVDVIWQGGEPSPVAVSLRVADGATELVAATGQVSPLAGELWLSRHALAAPAELARGSYALYLGQTRLGDIDLRQFETPPELGQVRGVEFGGQVALTGYQFEPSEDYLAVTLAWQALQTHLPDYTVFAQLLASDTQTRVAGIDSPPLKGDYPTSRWLAGEVVVDRAVVAVPPDLPPGRYDIIVGLYRPETGQRLLLPNGQDYWLLPWTLLWKGQES